MPFRCTCGRTFEVTDSFESHIYGCAPFHRRRMSNQEDNRSSTQQDLSGTSFGTDTMTLLSNKIFEYGESISHRRRSFKQQQPSSPTDSINTVDSYASELSTSPSYFFLPTSLNIQNVFDGARRRA
ncbi:uncharacterized protein BX663DRAFT_399235, partial [Cokeromyces recurvatus]|uniref:uncharacterized protein n=1 Tax=Cokeromyces recurvatus TaxID=90255 RepID=UPI0022209D9D